MQGRENRLNRQTDRQTDRQTGESYAGKREYTE